VSNDHEAFLTWFHSGADDVDITLPGLPWAASYEVVWHSADEDELPTGTLATGTRLTLPGRSVVLLRATVPLSSVELLRLQEEHAALAADPVSEGAAAVEAG
jgi:glycogen operon protein